MIKCLLILSSLLYQDQLLYTRSHRNDDRVKKISSRGYHDDQYSSLRLSSKKKSHPPRSVIESHKSM